MSRRGERASAEAFRVLAPGGRFGADHLTRDPVPYLESAGFTVDEVHRSG
ncbi:hypothetical protein [Rhodococcus daqingensis]|uniref:Methyltransferase n=1 Tax=Rhodococcus daqingensis TaxID=2479363 RepID=A0ABW2RST6_9NOCA